MGYLSVTRFLASFILSLFVVSTACGATVTKGLIGKEDIRGWDGGATNTFTRTSSDGYAMTLHDLDWVGVDVCKEYGGGVNRTRAVISAALTAVGAVNNRLFFLSPGNWTITDDLDCTAYCNVYFYLPPGAYLVISTTKTLAMVDAEHVLSASPTQQIYSCVGTGAVTYAQGTTDHPARWGIDGTADEVQIQACIDAMPATAATPSVVELLLDEYTCADTITMDNYVVLKGRGKMHTIITASTMYYPFILIKGKTGSEVRDLKIDGNASGITPTGQVGIYVSGSKHCVIDSIYLTDIGKTAADPAGSYIHLNAWESADDEVVAATDETDSDCEYNTVSNCELVDSQEICKFGIRFLTNWNHEIVQTAYNYFVRRNHVYGNKLRGFCHAAIEIAGPATRDNTIQNNISTLALSHAGIEADKGANRNNFIGNHVSLLQANFAATSQWAYGCLGVEDPSGNLKYAYYNTFIGNTVDNMSGAIIGSYGIRLRWAVDNLIQGNLFNMESVAGTMTGIYLDNDVLDVCIKNNSVLNAYHGITNDGVDLGQNMRGIDINGNYIEGTYSGIYIADADGSYTLTDVSIKGNVVVNSGAAVVRGIGLGGDVNLSSITNNTVRGSDADEFGIYVNTADAVFVGGNEIRGTVNTGINIAAGSNNTSVQGNHVALVAGTPFADAGTTTSVGYNYGFLEASVSWNPANLVDGAGETKSLTVTGAALGDKVMVSAPYDLQDCVATGYVQAANTVEIRLQNESTGARDLASGTWRARCLRQ